MKNCIKCFCELTAFTWAPEKRQNYINKCRECIKDEKRAYHAEWRKKYPKKSSEASKRHKDKMRLEDPVKARAKSAYYDCKKRAIKNGMEFDLTPAIVLQMMRESFVCQYLGVNLTFSQGNKLNTLASIDRIDSTRGYTADNVQIISYLANLMKSHASESELIQFASGVIKIHGLGGLRTYEKINEVASTTHK